MVNYIPINCTNELVETSNMMKKTLEWIFQNTQYVNVHVIFNFKSPIDVLGTYQYVMFIDVPTNEAGNNVCYTSGGVQLKSLAIAIRSYEDDSVVDFDDTNLYTSEGQWNYRESLAEERNKLRNFVRENINDVMFFNIAVFHRFKSASCQKKSRNEYMLFNTKGKLLEMISFAVENNLNSYGTAAEFLVHKKDHSNYLWTDFVPQFIGESEKITKQGILTLKKINQITKENLSKDVEHAIELAGKKLTIVKGRAGTGKSMTLMKVMHRKVKKDDEKRNHRCRFLTYNNLLVMDIRLLLRSMGDCYSPSNASVSTLHKYFQKVYKSSPVRYFHMDSDEIDRLFLKCRVRVTKFVTLMRVYADEHNDRMYEAGDVLEYWKTKGKIEEDEVKECELFCKYLKKKDRFVTESILNDIEELSIEYQEDKRKRFDENFASKEFLNDYNRILEELYLMFHNYKEFAEKYGLECVYSDDEIRQTTQYSEQQHKSYKEFIAQAKKNFVEEHDLVDEEKIMSFIEDEGRLLAEYRDAKLQQSEEEQLADLERRVKKVRRTVNWSDLILVDEAQDCTPIEKALLMEMHGSDNIVIASGGKDQLIRTSQETDWKILFGTPIDVENITLSYVHRQKANIVSFINAFAKSFGMDVNLQASESSKNQGNIIIDVRSEVSVGKIPEDIVDRLYKSGKDYGCADYENELFLLPRGDDYLQRIKTNQEDVIIDKNDTIDFRPASPARSLNVKLPNYINPLDCTILNKGKLFDYVGFDKTRCLLYESCRGIEAWNVLCIDLDKFYYQQLGSEDAIMYAESSRDLFFNEERKNQLQHQYATMWMLMALTRAIDTLYIRLSNNYNEFSQKLVSIANTLPNIELLA